MLAAAAKNLVLVQTLLHKQLMLLLVHGPHWAGPSSAAVLEWLWVAEPTRAGFPVYQLS